SNDKIENYNANSISYCRLTMLSLWCFYIVLELNNLPHLFIAFTPFRRVHINRDASVITQS
ncbi:9202_t:CDS:2, partial [Gigaspora rosea]